jgi:hypothetical protein
VLDEPRMGFRKSVCFAMNKLPLQQRLRLSRWHTVTGLGVTMVEWWWFHRRTA